MISASAPAKLILSGEHAVVYGAPALAAAVSPRAQVRVSELPKPEVVLLLDGIEQRLSILDCLDMQADLDDAHEAFLDGELEIQDVLESGRQLFFYLAAQWLQPDSRQGVKIELDSAIPIGAGLGSSAATIAAVASALAQFYGEPMDASQLIALTRFVERLQHGRGSAIDATTVVQGGVLYLHQDQVETLAPLQGPWWLVHSGQPQCSTGECVSQVRQQFADSSLWQTFSQVTQGLRQALLEHDQAGIISAISANQRLLEQIGVVPAPVQQFIRQLEAKGGAAKVCGAGAIRGDQAGAVLVYGVDPSDLVLAAGYRCTALQGEQDGAHVAAG